MTSACLLTSILIGPCLLDLDGMKIRLVGSNSLFYYYFALTKQHQATSTLGVWGRGESSDATLTYQRQVPWLFCVVTSASEEDTRRSTSLALRVVLPVPHGCPLCSVYALEL